MVLKLHTTALALLLILLTLLVNGGLVECQDKPATLSQFGYGSQATSVHVHDLSRQTEANARTCWLGGEKRDKDPLQYIGSNTGAVVAYLYVNPAVVVDTRT